MVFGVHVINRNLTGVNLLDTILINYSGKNQEKTVISLINQEKVRKTFTPGWNLIMTLWHFVCYILSEMYKKSTYKHKNGNRQGLRTSKSLKNEEKVYTKIETKITRREM